VSAGEEGWKLTTKGNQPDGEILLEIRQVGPQFRVAAIHALTGVEVVFVAPLRTTREQMVSLARAKLARRLDRESGSGNSPGGA